MGPFLKYLVINIPEWALGAIVLSVLVEWKWLSWPTALALFSIWIVVEIAVYPFLRTALEGDGSSGVESLIGMKARVRDTLDPSGFVSLRGELWGARVADEGIAVPVGSVVRVAAADGLTLIVVPVESAPSSAPT